jgi:hypothetical protein
MIEAVVIFVDSFHYGQNDQKVLFLLSQAIDDSLMNLTNKNDEYFFDIFLD